MSRVIKVFISSTYKDLVKEREAVEKALQRFKATSPVDMKYFGSRPETPLETSLKEVAESDVYVGIFAYRYGTIPEDYDKSITELEYRKAIGLQKPPLIYIMKTPIEVVPYGNVEKDEESQKKLEALKKKLQSKHVSSPFESPDELASQVIADLSNLILQESPVSIDESPYGLLRMYLESVRHQYRWLKILYTGREVEMNDLFIMLKLSRRFSDVKFDHEMDVDKRMPGRKETDLSEQAGITIEQALGKHNKLVILGDPGSGKTTTLRNMAYKYAVQNLSRLKKGQEPRLIPIYIPLGDCGEAGKALPDYIWDVVRSYALPLSAAENLETHFKSGKAILFLDGLDEVPKKDHKQVARLIEGIMSRYPNNPVVLSSRPAGYENYLLPGKVFEIQPLPVSQIKDFIQKWFALLDEEKKGEELWSALNQQKRMMDLASNPFLLSVICLMKERGKELPNRRVELYGLCVNTLLSLWDEARGLERNKYDPMLKEDIIKELALHFYEKGELSLLEIRDVVSFVREELKKYDNLCSPNDILGEIEHNSGILRKFSYSHYSFVHRTLYEYFVALAISADGGKSKKLHNYLNEKSDNPEWDEIFRLAAGLLEDPNPFLEAMFKKNPTLAARCYLDADQAKVDHGLIKKQWTENIERGERVEIVLGLRESMEDEQERLDFIQAVFRTGETDSEVLFECDEVLRGIGTKDAVKLSGEMFDWWPEERQFKSHKKAFEDDIYWKFSDDLAGTFLMGSRDKEAHSDEKPVHEVELSAFRLQRYPVTVAQYGRFDPTHREKRIYDEFGGKDDLPVVRIDWFDAYIFAKWARCRLPTEAEWEYAAGCGGKNKWGLPGGFDKDKYCYDKESTCSDGSYPANEFGLHDMSGNVWEWCWDWFDENYYKRCIEEDIRKNPRGPDTGSQRVRRGGSWIHDDPVALRVSFRYWFIPRYGFNNIGFRCLQDSP